MPSSLFLSSFPTSFSSGSHSTTSPNASSCCGWWILLEAMDLSFSTTSSFRPSSSDMSLQSILPLGRQNPPLALPLVRQLDWRRKPKTLPSMPEFNMGSNPIKRELSSGQCLLDQVPSIPLRTRKPFAEASAHSLFESGKSNTLSITSMKLNRRNSNARIFFLHYMSRE